MKNISLIIFVLLSFSIHAQDKTAFDSFKVIYNKSFKLAAKDSDSSPKPIAGIEYELTANKKESRFEYIEGLMLDHQESNKRFIGLGGGAGIFYKNIEDEELIREIEENGKTYLITLDYNKYNWKLVKESKEILGFTCYKAIGTYTEYHPFAQKDITYEHIVWYAPEIPLPFGPGEYTGVPGLILEAVDGSFYMIAEDIEFYKKEKKIKKPIKGIEITESDFNQLIYEQLSKKVGHPIKAELPDLKKNN